MITNLILKHRLIWDISTRYIQNDYETDYTGSITSIVNSGDINFIESDNYEDILDKIKEEHLMIEPSTDELLDEFDVEFQDNI